MAKIDTNDLLDAMDVARALGLKNHRVVAAYRSRYPDFPQPIVTKSSGKCVLWLRADIEAWAETRKKP